jgi:hypothetical protein
MGDLPSIAVAVFKIETSSRMHVLGFPIAGAGTPANMLVSSGKDYMAVVLANPKLRADGCTREEALERLSFIIYSHITSEAGSLEIVNLSFDELIVKEVMNS